MGLSHHTSARYWAKCAICYVGHIICCQFCLEQDLQAGTDYGIGNEDDRYSGTIKETLSLRMVQAAPAKVTTENPGGKLSEIPWQISQMNNPLNDDDKERNKD